MAAKRILSLNAMDKLMREAGAQRVSDDAKEALADILEEKALEYASAAKKAAEHAGRKTITGKDVRFGSK